MAERSKVQLVAEAIREETVRQHRDKDRQKCPAGIPFWGGKCPAATFGKKSLSPLTRSQPSRITPP